MEITQASLDKLKKALKERAGHNTGAELECDSEADEIKIYEKILKDAKNKARTKYSWNPFNSNHCRSVANDAFNAGLKSNGWW